MPRKIEVQKPRDVKEKVWQVIKETTNSSGNITHIQNVGIPCTLESAKNILLYKNAGNLKSNVRYRIEHINDK